MITIIAITRLLFAVLSPQLGHLAALGEISRPQAEQLIKFFM
jgi:hypothetical protein